MTLPLGVQHWTVTYRIGVCRGHGGYTGICIWAVTQIRVCGGVKGIYLLSDDTAHLRNNTENFCVGPFCRCEFKVKIWFADGLVLWRSEDDI